jgi:hypothetical protein
MAPLTPAFPWQFVLFASKALPLPIRDRRILEPTSFVRPHTQCASAGLARPCGPL